MKQFRTLAVALTAAVATTLGGGALVLAGPGTAGAVAVGDETALLAAFADAAETEIVLTADVDLTCGGGAAVRASAVPVVVDGQGSFTITQTCAETVLFGASGGGGVSVRDVTLVGGIAAIEADGPIAVTGSRITGQTSATGPVAGVAQDNSSMPVTITDSVIDTIATTAADESAYGVAGGLQTVTRSAISGITSPGLSAGINGSGSAVVASTIRDLSGGAAAGIYTLGPSASVTGSTIAHLTASVESAIGVLSSGDTVVDGSRITDLVGPLAAGLLGGGDVTLSASTVAGVHGSVYSFGVIAENDGSRLTVRNATVTDVDGPGIIGTDVTVVYSTVRGNGGLNGSVGDLSVLMDAVVEPLARPAALEALPQILTEGSLTLFGSAVVDPEPGMANCLAPSVAAIVSAGYNFADDTSCALTGPGDRQGAGLDPLLGGLDENGGLAPTFLPQSGSPLLDAIPLDACQSGPAAGITTDERGEPRPSFLGCDIGAVEVQVVLRFTG